MNKTKLITSLGGAIAVSLLAAPLAQALENPFALQNVTTATHLAEMGKGADGKCGEGKCGDKKMQEGGCNGAMEKAKEGKCSDGKCGDKKMKEGGCSAAMEKMSEGKCSDGKCGDKM
ncbi:MAG: hypothetical protein RQ733_09280 [Methyloprofundus sp.]|nr:hypothetical protein [Methyloprofundus sp.]MDT8426152.1 hypothetical protein [Methyloprofundus sp.]